MFEPSRFTFLAAALFLLSDNGAQCYYPQSAPYAPYPYPYPYMGQYAPVQPPSWNHFYPPYPYGPVPAVAPAVAPANVPAYQPPVATPAPASQKRPSPTLPIIDFKKGSIIDYEYFYDNLPEDFGNTRMIIMINKTASATVTATPAAIVSSKPVFKPPSFEDLQEDQSTEERVVDETTERTNQVETEEDPTEVTDSLDEDVTEESVSDEVTTEEPIEETTVPDDYQVDEDEYTTPSDY